jgi:hypothetical protein
VLVGPCYILGLMGGEVIKGIEEWKAAASDFEI